MLGLQNKALESYQNNPIRKGSIRADECLGKANQLWRRKRQVQAGDTLHLLSAPATCCWNFACEMFTNKMAEKEKIFCP